MYFCSQATKDEADIVDADCEEAYELLQSIVADRLVHDRQGISRHSLRECTCDPLSCGFILKGDHKGVANVSVR